MLVRLAFWFAVSLTLLSASAWLTMRVTLVEGQPPTAVFSDAARKAWTVGQHRIEGAQFFGVLFEKKAEPSAQDGAEKSSKPVASVRYGTRNFGDMERKGAPASPLIWFFMPENRESLLLVNNLVGTKSGAQCKTSGPLPEAPIKFKKSNRTPSIFTVKRFNSNSPGQSYNFQFADNFTYNGVKIYYARFPAFPYPYVVYCRVRPKYTKTTFTTRTVDFVNIAPGQAHTIESAFNAGVINVSADFPGYAPPETLPITLNIVGADRLSFAGGRQDFDLETPESTRVLRAGGSLTAEWSDVSREQLRDVLLVVIGTLIAFGVTTLIEGLRPLIDGRRLASEVVMMAEHELEQEAQAEVHAAREAMSEPLSQPDPEPAAPA